MGVIHRRAHILAWGALAVLLPVMLGAALWQRLDAPAPQRPVLLAPP
jgi:hypothetical protein